MGVLYEQHGERDTNDVYQFVTDGTRSHYAGTRVAVTRLNACLTTHCAASLIPPIVLLDSCTVLCVRVDCLLQQSERSFVYSRG